MLRTLIEQWARSQMGVQEERADELMDQYMSALPDDFRGRFASMRALYGDLSVDIHGAVGSASLFERAMQEIVEHFDARKLFRLDAVSPTSPASETPS